MTLTISAPHSSAAAYNLARTAWTNAGRILLATNLPRTKFAFASAVGRRHNALLVMCVLARIIIAHRSHRGNRHNPSSSVTERLLLSAVLSLLTACFAGSRVLAQCGEWLPGEGISGLSNGVTTAALWDPDGAGPRTPVLVVGGGFRVAGRTLSNSVAYWDGSDWHALGEGTGSYGTVHALAVYNGELVMAGDFYPANGAPGLYIARWDGSQWRPMGGTNARINALTVFRGELIAGGVFTFPGSLIARWNGTTWQPLWTGLSGSAVSALAVYNDRLFAAGTFESAGGQVAGGIAQWDGSFWQAVGNGLTFPSFSRVEGLAVYYGELLASGLFTMAGGEPARGIARWNGTAWHAATAGLSTSTSLSHRFTLATEHEGVLYASGGFTSTLGQTSSLAYWDGASWHIVGPNMGYPGAVASFQGELITGGTNATADGQPARGIARWNGQAFHSLGSSPITGWTTALAEYNSEVIAAGPGEYSPPVGRMVRWNGSQWTPFRQDATDNAYLLTTFYGDLIRSNGPSRWTGSGWATLGTGITPYGGLPSNLPAFAAYQGSLYVGGSFPGGNIARWNGTAWGAVGGALSAPSSAMVRAIRPYGGELLAGGTFTSANGVAVQNLALWNGSAWRPFGIGIPAGVTSLAIYRGQVIAGGCFSSLNGVPVNSLARWDGAAWQPLGEGSNTCVNAMTVYHGRLIASGNFRSPTGAAINGVGRWDGATWSPMGNGTDQGPQSFLIHDDQLFMCGNFNIAGGQVSAYIARWRDCVADLDNGSGTGICDGGVTIDDLLYYTTLYADGVARADIDDGSSTGTPDGGVTIDDLLYFLLRYEAGC